MSLIPREMWADYLIWFRRTLDLPVENGVRVCALGSAGPYVRAEIERAGKRESLVAREVVIATGFDGSGGPQIPESLVANLPRRLWAHTTDEEIDLARIKSKSVGVLGAGASAFDNAIWALEKGATEAHLFVRKPSLPAVNFMRGVEYAGFFRHFAALDDAARWKFMRVMFSLSTPPPPPTLEKALATPGFHMHLGCPWLSAREADGEAEVETPEGRHRFAFLIFGTGFAMDVRRQPELAAGADNILLWRDRYTPPPDEESATLARQPFLGPGFELMEKSPGTTPWFAHVRYWAISSWGSMGPAAVGLNGYKYGLIRLIDGIGRSLFLADAEAHYETYRASANPTP
jgi:cation diffusion facilitator CzcD-associated flavoprotein CzcO